MKQTTNIVECEITVSIEKAKNFINELMTIFNKYEIDVELNENQDIILNISHLIEYYYTMSGRNKINTGTVITVTTTEYE